MLCHWGKPGGQRFSWVSDLSLVAGRFWHWAFSRPPERSNRLALTMSLKINASSHHCYNWHRTISLSTDRSALHPLPGLLPTWQPSLWETVAQWTQMTKVGRMTSAEGYSPGLGEAWGPISTLSREALFGDPDGHVPQTVTLPFWTGLDIHTANVGFSKPWLFSGHLIPGLLHSFLAWVSISDDQARELCPEPENLSFSVLGCACRATLLLLPIHSGLSRTSLKEVSRSVFAVLNV